MGSFESDLRILETELGVVAEAFGELSDEQWRAPTLLMPLDARLPHWTLFELAGHFDISIGLTRMLISSQQDGQVGRDRVSFFIFSRVEHAPTVYDYAYTMVEGRSPGQMAGVLAETFTRTIEEARANPPELVGSGYYALMQLGEFAPSRVVEAVVHGMDLTDALGQDPIATPEGVAMTAAIFDELIARRTVPGRPGDLADDMAWVRAASGRAPHPDPRLPLVG